MAVSKHSHTRRTMSFEKRLYRRLMDSAEDHSRTFPQHVMRILEDHLDSEMARVA